MTNLLFRNSFAARYRVGDKRKFISARTKKLLPTEASILILDLDYFCFLLQSKQQNKKELVNIKEFLLLWINTASKTVYPKGIIGVYSDSSVYIEPVINVLNSFSIAVIKEKLPNYIYSGKLSGILTDPLCIITNNLTVWAISNTAANLFFIAIDSNNRAILYNNTTGLDFFCKFILTNKLMNKLGLHHIKYLNLQYLYLLLLYINFTNSSAERDFFFDSDFILSLNKHKLKNISFSRSNGLGLALLSDAHKFISYAFLTKPEFMDMFLLGNGHEYQVHLTRLQKLLPFDIQVLSKLLNFYQLHYKISQIPVQPTNYKLPSSFPELHLSRFWTDTPKKLNTIKDITMVCKLIRQYRTLHKNVNISTVLELLPNKEKNKLSAYTTVFPKNDDTMCMGINDYISSLLTGL